MDLKTLGRRAAPLAGVLAAGILGGRCSVRPERVETVKVTDSGKLNKDTTKKTAATSDTKTTADVAKTTDNEARSTKKFKRRTTTTITKPNGTKVVKVDETDYTAEDLKKNHGTENSHGESITHATLTQEQTEKLHAEWLHEYMRTVRETKAAKDWIAGVQVGTDLGVLLGTREPTGFQFGPKRLGLSAGVSVGRRLFSLGGVDVYGGAFATTKGDVGLGGWAAY